jgi:hypothetical protein
MFQVQFSRQTVLISLLTVGLGTGVHAQVPSLNTFGSPGLIDMPTAHQMPDGTLAATVSYVNDTVKSTLAFQVTPRISGVFRYSYFGDFSPELGNLKRDLYDRSFDLRYQLAYESDFRPAITIGLQDFAGTGFFGAEYIVATKTLNPNLKISAGLGWGRLATHGSFTNPLTILSDRFRTRPSRVDSRTSGTPKTGIWFRGPAAPFAGIEWTSSNKKTRLKAEYSSDKYASENNANPGFLNVKTPINFSAEYRLGRNNVISAHVIGGSEIGFRFSTSLHPHKPAVVAREEAPLPVRNRGRLLATQRAKFGDVINVVDVESNYGVATPHYTMTQSQSGVRIAHVRGDCNPSAAREVDAQEGVVDLVLFETGAGGVSCSVVTRPAGQTYIEAISARQPIIARGNDIVDTRIDGMVSRLQALVETDGISIVRSDINEYRAEVQIRSTRFNASAQAVGRMARAMTHVLPTSIEILNIVLLSEGLPTTSVELHRSDLELLEHDADGAWKSLARAEITSAPKRSGQSQRVDGFYPKLAVSLKPSIESSFFDPDNPFRFDLKARGTARYDIMPGLSLNAVASKRLVGNVNTSTRLSNSVLQHVRSDIGLYQNAGDATIDRLTADYMFKITPDVYGRISTGIFERMYGGASAEVLWAPAERRIALGAEVNWVKQRAYKQHLDFMDYSTVTGHVSAYWDIGNGFASQLDVGRYLAKDWGATLSVDRVFNNGWKVGGYFTLTDVSFDDFGEGSFDKGIKLDIPLSWITGSPSQNTYSTVIQPILRDGGARVFIPNRLYDTIQGSRPQAVKNSWGRFWR